MKNILESQEVFEAYARIDYNYWQMGKLQESMANRKPIDIIIDKSTGYDAEYKQKAIEIIEQIITDKKLIGSSTERDELVLEGIKNINP